MNDDLTFFDMLSRYNEAIKERYYAMDNLLHCLGVYLTSQGRENAVILAHHDRLVDAYQRVLAFDKSLNKGTGDDRNRIVEEG